MSITPKTTKTHLLPNQPKRIETNEKKVYAIKEAYKTPSILISHKKIHLI